jgi:hypothetical protein
MQIECVENGMNSFDGDSFEGLKGNMGNIFLFIYFNQFCFRLKVVKSVLSVIQKYMF